MGDPAPVSVIVDAQILAQEHIEFILKKTRFFQRFDDLLNERQIRVIRRIFEEGPQGFQGGMSTKKYITITGTSKATATRDLQDLVTNGALISSGAGRSTRYQVNLG